MRKSKQWRGPGRGPPDLLHWAQAKAYAALYLLQEGLDSCEIQVTYLELETGETVQFRERFSSTALNSFFDATVAEYLDWIREHQSWCKVRDSSIKSLAFPFPSYRTGQRGLAVAVYRTIKGRGRLFAEAPTGIGKTVSVLFPAIKAVGEGHCEKLFYLTAKTIGREVAENTTQKLRSSGLRLRAVTITAKDKICFNSGQQPCDPKTCPFAIGYYDRLKAALRDGFQTEALTRSEIEHVARRHQVCPFELSLDLSLWADAIICDYNYVFDPSASLKRYFDGEKHDYAILIDEAHNLVDRAREMFSASLDRHELLNLKKAIGYDLPAAAKALAKIASRMAAVGKEGFVNRAGNLVSKTAPQKLAPALNTFVEEAESWLAHNSPAAFHASLLDVYFRVRSFLRTLERFDEGFTAIYSREETLRLFCVDPSACIRQALARTGAAIFFSATLRPVDYFRESLGGTADDPVLHLTSPFPHANLRVLVHRQIATTWQKRADSYDDVATAVAEMVSAKAGNYLVYFPSYEYLRRVLAQFVKRFPDFRVQAQTAGMTETQRDEFVSAFRSRNTEPILGFVVLNGIFGEGIDLVGEYLIGVTIVGVGLPQLCLERDLIREHFHSENRLGFDYAYTFAGLNRVVQAVGRVLRSESDHGVALLIDQRFGQPKYQQLLPPWWTLQFLTSVEEIKIRATQFWESIDKAGAGHA